MLLGKPGKTVLREPCLTEKTQCERCVSHCSLGWCPRLDEKGLRQSRQRASIQSPPLSLSRSIRMQGATATPIYFPESHQASPSEVDRALWDLEPQHQFEVIFKMTEIRTAHIFSPNLVHCFPFPSLYPEEIWKSEKPMDTFGK